MRFAAVVVAAAALVSSLCACKSEPVTGTLSETLVTSSATVEKVDMASRHVSVRRADGSPLTIVCGPEVRNLDKVNVGDEVVVSYHESVAYEVKKPDDAKPGVTIVGASGRAKAGEQPHAGAGMAMTVTVTITAIDTAAPTVTLRGPNGDVIVVPVKDREKLERVSVGDLVELTYTEAMAVSVQPKK